MDSSIISTAKAFTCHVPFESVSLARDDPGLTAEYLLHVSSEVMADPFSAAAGAVSFISLGIQVCQGLVSYCNAWKSYDRDIGDALERLDGLQRTLETLRDILPKVDEPNLSASPVLQNVSSQILSCDKGLRKLQAALMKFRSAGAPSDVRKSLHNLKQRGLYPLRKKELQELQTTVAGIQANLDSAVLVHGL